MNIIKTFESFFKRDKLDFNAIIKLNPEWKMVIEKAFNNIPGEAIPTVVCNFSNLQKITNRKDIITKITKQYYGVTIQCSSVVLPKEYLTDEIVEFMKSTGFYNERIIEVSDTFTLHDFMLNSSIQVVAFNSNLYKTLADIDKRKEQIDQSYFERTNNRYFFNKYGEATIYHEFGHVYNNRKRISDRPQWVSLSNRWYLESKLDLLKNSSEAFSEAFADYYINNGNRLPDYIKEYLDSLNM